MAGSYTPDFSEADPGYGGIDALPSADLYTSLQNETVTRRLGMGKGNNLDRAYQISRIPGIVGRRLWEGLSSGATLLGETLAGEYNPTPMAEGEDPNTHLYKQRLKEEEMAGRVMDTAGLATMGGGLAHGLSSAKPMSALHAAPKEGVVAGVAAMADRPKLYSAADRTIEESGLKAATGDQWAATLRNKGVKPDELANIEEWLTQHSQRKIPQAEVRAKVREATPQIEEVWKGTPPQGARIQQDENGHYQILDENGEPIPGRAYANRQDAEYYLKHDLAPATKFHQYQVPGGENYREMLVTLPRVESVPDKTGRYTSFDDYNYRSSHWDEPNVLAHVRMNDRYLGEPAPEAHAAYAKAQEDHSAAIARAEESYAKIGEKVKSSWPTASDLEKQKLNEQLLRAGDLVNRVKAAAPKPPVGSQKTLFLEELQSDMHQEGRDGGYKISDDQAHAIADRIRPDPSYKDAITTNMVKQAKDTGKITPDEFRDFTAWQHGSGVPDAPFKGSKNWGILLLKRMVSEAADQGYDAIAWTDGATQADRYDLSKHVDRVMYNEKTGRLSAVKGGQTVLDQTDVTPQKLADYIGKEPADKLLKSEEFPGGSKYLEGEGLKVGGEGMRGFYDQMLPRMANKLFGKWGVKTKIEPKAVTDKDGQLRDVHILPITPELRAHATQRGFPLYSNPKESAAAGAAVALSAENPTSQLLLPKPRGDYIHDYKKGGDPWERLLNKYPEHQNEVTHVDRSHVEKYSDGLYRPIADHLYKDHPLAKDAAPVMHGLDDLLSRTTIPTNLVVWRGISTKTLSDIESLQPGQTWVHKGFLSTSLSRKFANGWKSGYVKIVLPKGSRGLVMGRLSEHTSENEVLLPRNLPLFYQGKDAYGIPNFAPAGEGQMPLNMGNVLEGDKPGTFVNNATNIDKFNEAKKYLQKKGYNIGDWDEWDNPENVLKLAKTEGWEPPTKDFGDLPAKLSEHPENLKDAKKYLKQNAIDTGWNLLADEQIVKEALDHGWQPKTIEPKAAHTVDEAQAAYDFLVSKGEHPLADWGTLPSNEFKGKILAKAKEMGWGPKAKGLTLEEKAQAAKDNGAPVKPYTPKKYDMPSTMDEYIASLGKPKIEKALDEAGWENVGGGDEFDQWVNKDNPHKMVYLKDNGDWEYHDLDKQGGTDSSDAATDKGWGLQPLLHHIKGNVK